METFSMWSVLFYVTPVTLSAALLLLFVFSLCVATVARNEPDSLRRYARLFLAVSTSVYVLILVGPPSGDIQTQTSRIVHWNPLHFMDELESGEAAEEGFGQYLTDGKVAYYTPSELSAVEREAVRQTNPADFFAYGDTEAGVTVVDSTGSPVDPTQEKFVVSEISESISLAGEPVQYQTMILEEKSLNALLFVPLGILAYFSFSSWWMRASFGPIASASIEIIQWITAVGNVSDAADILANSLGHFSGVGMAAVSMMLVVLRSKVRSRVS